MKAAVLVEESDAALLSFLKKSGIEVVVSSLRFKDYVTNYCLAKLDYVVNAKGINCKAKFKRINMCTRFRGFNL